MDQRLIRISENIIIDISDIAMCKRVKVDEKIDEWHDATEVVLRGDKQIYRYHGDAGLLLWNVVKDSALPVYASK